MHIYIYLLPFTFQFCLFVYEVCFYLSNILERNLHFQLVITLQQSTNIHNALLTLHVPILIKKKKILSSISPTSTSILFFQDSLACVHSLGPGEICESEQNFCSSLSSFSLDAALQS